MNAEAEIAQSYIRNPSLPMRKYITIKRIHAINHDRNTGDTLGLLSYGSMHRLYPLVYPNTNMDDFQVSPILIVDDHANVFKIAEAHWLSFIRIIIHTDGHIPTLKVFIDPDGEWVRTMVEILDGLH